MYRSPREAGSAGARLLEASQAPVWWTRPVAMPRKVSHRKKAAAAASPAPEKKEEKEGEEADPDDHPFKVGAWLVAKWLPDSSERLCTIIERARGVFGGKTTELCVTCLPSLSTVARAPAGGPRSRTPRL